MGLHLRAIVNQTTRYYYIISCLPADVCIEVADVVNVRPPDRPYEILKERLKKTGDLLS